SRTLDRLLDVFPPEQQEHVRMMVAESLRGVISHQLIPRKDGTGRVLALEILTNTTAVANVIRENKTYLLPGIIQTGKKQGMRLMDDALIDLYGRGLISAEEAYRRADQKHIVQQQLRMYGNAQWLTSINSCKSSSGRAHRICISLRGNRQKSEHMATSCQSEPSRFCT